MNPANIVSLIVGVCAVPIILILLATTTGSATWQTVSGYVAPVVVFIALFAFTIGVIYNYA